jgi:hypothetical protein
MDWHDYAFMTNYLGLAIGLLSDLKKYLNEKQIENFNPPIKQVEMRVNALELKQAEMRVDALELLWKENLMCTMQQDSNFYNRRRIQYAQSKEVLLMLINLILQIGDSSWLGFIGEKSQRFRDALVFSTHMGGLSKYKTVV